MLLALPYYILCRLSVRPSAGIKTSRSSARSSKATRSTLVSLKTQWRSKWIGTGKPLDILPALPRLRYIAGLRSSASRRIYKERSRLFVHAVGWEWITSLFRSVIVPVKVLCRFSITTKSLCWHLGLQCSSQCTKQPSSTYFYCLPSLLTIFTQWTSARSRTYILTSRCNNASTLIPQPKKRN